MRSGQVAFHAGGCSSGGKSSNKCATRLANCSSGQRNSRREGLSGSPLCRWRPTKKSTRPFLPRLLTRSSSSQASRAKRSPLVRSPSGTRRLSGRNRSPWIDSGRSPSLVPATINCGASSHANSSQPCRSIVSAGRSGNSASRLRSSSTSVNSCVALRPALVGTAASSLTRLPFSLAMASMQISSAVLALSNSRSTRVIFKKPAKPIDNGSFTNSPSARCSSLSAVRAVMR